MATRMLQRRGTAAEWAATNPVLGDGEVGVERNTGVVKIGDGVTAWASLTNVYRRFVDAVAKAGDTMTGDLKISKNNASLQLEESVTDRLHVIADTGLQYIQVDDELRITSIGAGALKTLSAGNIYDNGNRVYSASNPQPASNPFAVIDALGDLLVGSGPDAVARLAKGSNGQVLTISAGGVVNWQTPVDASTKVSKSGDIMTGGLTAPSFSTSESVYSGSSIELGQNRPSSGVAFIDFHTAVGSDYEARIRCDTNAINIEAPGGLQDNGNRVYSASNPPPASGAMILQSIRGSSVSTGNVGIPTVNVAKAQTRWNGSKGFSSGSQPGAPGYAYLSGATTVYVGMPSVMSNSPEAWFEVTEWS